MAAETVQALQLFSLVSLAPEERERSLRLRRAWSDYLFSLLQLHVPCTISGAFLEIEAGGCPIIN